MKDLTISSLVKTFNKRFNFNCEFIKYTLGNTKIRPSIQFILTIRSIMTFYDDDQLKKFLNEELPKLTYQDIKNLIGENKIEDSLLHYSFIDCINDKDAEYTDTELIFLVLFGWKIFSIISEKNKYNYLPYTKTILSFIFVIEQYSTPHIKEETYSLMNESDRIVLALFDVDYLDWFDKIKFRKEYFECILDIKGEAKNEEIDD